MNYSAWSDEYFNECEKILRNIEVLKGKLKNTTADELKELTTKIAIFRSIYYELNLTAKHLLARAE